jgi:hypothetical protein
LTTCQGGAQVSGCPDKGRNRNEHEKQTNLERGKVWWGSDKMARLGSVEWSGRLGKAKDATLAPVPG